MNPIEGSRSQNSDVISRAQGCLMGQLAGDALGGLVEFRTASDILREYPKGVRDLADGGTWGTIAGQPTDDSEMALTLARVIAKEGTYNSERARQAYYEWMQSGPFDCGATVSSGLLGFPNSDSQANGALMRISPLGIFGANHPLESVGEWARQDAMITHPNTTCHQANSLFAMALAHAIISGCEAMELYQKIVKWSQDFETESNLRDSIERAANEPPSDYTHQAGWVLIALQNALWQLLHAPNLEEAIVNTVMCGGDADTNAAICGALTGAVYGLCSVPDRWVDVLLNCRPDKDHAHVLRPRPQCYWPVDALSLAEDLIRL